MHAEQFAYMPYPQLDGEKETNEGVYRSYPHPPPVAIEDLSSENKEILHSVSPIPEERMEGLFPPHLAPGSVSRPTADPCLRVRARTPKQIIQGSRARVPEPRGRTRRYAAIFDEKGLPLPSATGVVIGGARSSMLADESETEPIVIHHAVASGKPAGFRAALRRRISSAARSVFTCS